MLFKVSWACAEYSLLPSNTVMIWACDGCICWRMGPDLGMYWCLSRQWRIETRLVDGNCVVLVTDGSAAVVLGCGGSFGCGGMVIICCCGQCGDDLACDGCICWQMGADLGLRWCLSVCSVMAGRHQFGWR